MISIKLIYILLIPILIDFIRRFLLLTNLLERLQTVTDHLDTTLHTTLIKFPNINPFRCLHERYGTLRILHQSHIT